jgi:NADH-quinone oxidoreductase subunit J
MVQYLFYFLAFVSVFCAFMVITSRNPVHSVLYLVITFFAIGCQYLLLNAQFLAAVHIIVYAGAIMVLFLYVIMLLNLNKDAEPQKSVLSRFAAVIAAGILLVVMTGSVAGADQLSNALPVNRDIGLIKNLGLTLFNKFLLPFELSSILFLGAMVGAVLIGKNEHK